MIDAPTLRTLLRRSDLALSLVTPEDPDLLDRPLRWVHSSDLADPTPFLTEDLVLLTTGTQFRDEDPVAARAYVRRLSERGVAGLGFGTEVYRAGIPAELVAACADARMPLFEVPYRTPFIAIARAHAEAIAAQAYARRTWALDAQRAIAIAALRPRGLESILSELARRLDVWVGLFDATGALAHQHPQAALDDEARGELAAHAGDLVARGAQATQSFTVGTQPFLLFTLGRGGSLRGVIALATGTLDAESRAVVTSVIAMAGLAREQSEQLGRRTARLNRQVLESLLLDDPTLARRVLGAVPAAPIVVAVAEADAPAEAIIEWCERRRTNDAIAFFAAEHRAGLTLCVSAKHEDLVADAAVRFAVRWGVSEADGYSTFSRLHDQARRALARATSPVSRYGDAASASMIGALATDEARLVAESRLAPVRRHDEANGTDLERSLRVWLEHDATLDAAAATLGVHRHTVRSRVAQASALLGLDLSTFTARAELWVALSTLSD